MTNQSMWKFPQLFHIRITHMTKKREFTSVQ